MDAEKLNQALYDKMAAEQERFKHNLLGMTPDEVLDHAYEYAMRQDILDYQQEQGLMSSLPLGLNQIAIQRGLTTSSTAIFVPFTTQELFMQGEALYYGLNALSNNLIMADRKQLKNPNGLILGTPGSGKSFSAKREITNAFLITQDDIAIIDPEDEYSPLVQRLGGQVIDISPTSDQFINPMDITLNYSEDDNPLTLKSDFILSLMELIVGGKAGLEPVEKTVVDRCVHMVYREYLQDPQPEKMPVLGDLHALLCQQPEPEAQRLATALEIYVSGSLNVFNHRTNVKINSRIVCYVIKKLGKQDRLGAVERGELSPEDFMAGITAMLTDMVKSYQNISATSAPAALSQSGRTVIGKCPRCGKNVVPYRREEPL